MVYGSLVREYSGNSLFKEDTSIIDESYSMQLAIEENYLFKSITESIEVLDIIQEGKVGEFFKGLIKKFKKALTTIGEKIKALIEKITNKINEIKRNNFAKKMMQVINDKNKDNYRAKLKEAINENPWSNFDITNYIDKNKVKKIESIFNKADKVYNKLCKDFLDDNFVLKDKEDYQKENSDKYLKELDDLIDKDIDKDFFLIFKDSLIDKVKNNKEKEGYKYVSFYETVFCRKSE